MDKHKRNDKPDDEDDREDLDKNKTSDTSESDDSLASDEDDEDEEEEEEEPKPRKKAALDKKAPEPVVKKPWELPLPPRNTEIMTGLGATVGGYVAFWYGWMVLSESVEKRNLNYFSHSAWTFLISFFCIIVAAFCFVRLERRPASKSTGQEGGDTSARPVIPHPPRKLDRVGVLLAAILCGPFYVAYWYKGYEIWSKAYAEEQPAMWIIYIALLAFMTLGSFHGLKPPSDEDEVNRRMPTRRVLMLLMTPFSLVYGMIYLANLYPPWPS